MAGKRFAFPGHFPLRIPQCARKGAILCTHMILEKLGQFVDPNVVVSHFHLREGERVADFGAGTGFYLPPLSAAVGGTGRVYACEIQKSLVEKLAQTAREKHLTNVEPLWCDLEAVGGTKLADGMLDAALLANTFFQLEEKEMALREIMRVVRSGGKVFIIDWTDSFGGMGPQPQYVVTAERTKEYFKNAGFSFEREFPTGDHHYGLVMRRV